MNIIKGQRLKLNDILSSLIFDIKIKIKCSKNVNLYYLKLDDNNKQYINKDDSIIYNNNLFKINLNNININIKKIIFFIYIDDETNLSEIENSSLSILQNNTNILNFNFNGSTYNSEKIIILSELYFKDSWKFVIINQGFDKPLDYISSYYNCYSKIENINKIVDIKNGNINPIIPSIIVDSDEICYLEEPVIYKKIENKDIDGRLVVSNKYIRFLSKSGGFKLKITSIVKVEDLNNCINLELSTKTGNGIYLTVKADVIASIIDTVVRIAKRQLVLFHKKRSTIPQNVKILVWNNCLGECVQCGSKNYLEYDHIIPISKGGSNEVNNLQLLCRECNLSKSNRI